MRPNPPQYDYTLSDKSIGYFKIIFSSYIFTMNRITVEGKPMNGHPSWSNPHILTKNEL